MRLAHLGIDVVEVCADEPPELCYIPMGGPRPDPRQRVVAFGAAAALVHPATGYQLCRALAAAPRPVGGARARPAAESRPGPRRAGGVRRGLVAAERALQREFALFGGEFLMTLDAEALRGWFAGFFALDEEVWGGFLAGWRGLPGNHHHESRAARLLFGLSLVPKLPPPVTLKLASFILEYSLKHGGALMRSLTPFFGDGALLPRTRRRREPPPGRRRGRQGGDPRARRGLSPRARPGPNWAADLAAGRRRGPFPPTIRPLRLRTGAHLDSPTSKSATLVGTAWQNLRPVNRCARRPGSALSPSTRRLRLDTGACPQNPG